MPTIVRDPITGEEFTYYTAAEGGISVPAPPLPSTAGGVVEHYAVIRPPRNVAQAMASNRAIHSYHLSLGWLGHAYSHAYDDDGNIYEARGSDRQPGATAGVNSTTRASVWLGGYGGTRPSARALRARRCIERLSRQRPRGGAHGPNRPHSHFAATSCPGPDIRHDLGQASGPGSPTSPPAPLPPTSAHTWRHYAGRILRPVTSGADVAEAQFGTNLGLGSGAMDRWTAVDGIYGPDTARAVADYQDVHRRFWNDPGMVVDGIFGPYTAGRLSFVLGLRSR